MEQERTEKGILIIKGNSISLESNFKIAVKGFGIKIPRLLTKNIAEVVDVKVKADLLPREKLISRQKIY
ncbi:MAG: hypothetical protein HY063_12000 [Bacteroidetes bacterium]|nr:hypothetical protein [Bacteroidota bacterium]